MKTLYYRVDSPLLISESAENQSCTKDLYSKDKEIRLVANDDIEVHPFLPKPKDMHPLVFDIPVEATQGGELILRWNSEEGTGSTGRGCQIAEVWLMKAGE